MMRLRRTTRIRAANELLADGWRLLTAETESTAVRMPGKEQGFQTPEDERTGNWWVRRTLIYLLALDVELQPTTPALVGETKEGTRVTQEAVQEPSTPPEEEQPAPEPDAPAEGSTEAAEDGDSGDDEEDGS